MTAELSRAAAREVTTEGRVKRMLSGPQCVLTAEELAGLVHLPNQEINAPRVDWERMESGRGTPVRGPGFTNNRQPASASRSQPQSQSQSPSSFESDPNPDTQETVAAEGPTHDAYDTRDIRDTHEESRTEAVTPENGREEHGQPDVLDVESQAPPSESQSRSHEPEPKNESESGSGYDEYERNPESGDDHSPDREQVPPEDEGGTRTGAGTEAGGGS